MNPFYQYDTPITSKAFDARVRAAARRYLSWWRSWRKTSKSLVSIACHIINPKANFKEAILLLFYFQQKSLAGTFHCSGICSDANKRHHLVARWHHPLSRVFGSIIPYPRYSFQDATIPMLRRSNPTTELCRIVCANRKRPCNTGDKGSSIVDGYNRGNSTS